MKEALGDVVTQMRPVRRSARVLYWGAAAWLISAGIHVLALAGDSWTWSGAVSFRKPISFSISIGLLLATVGWVLDRLPDRPRIAGALAWTLLVSSTIEVSLIAMQAWRGRPSHFNTFEPGDAAIFATMGMMVAVMSICLVAVFVWSLIERPADRLVRLAVFAGFLLVLTGLGIGQWIIGLGTEFADAHGFVPETVTAGEAGVAKFPHAVAFHGIQIFIIAAVMLRSGFLAPPTQRRLLWVIVTGYASVLGFASAQTVFGRSPLDLTVWSVAMVLGSVAVVYGLIRAFRGLESSHSGDRARLIPVP